MNNYQTHIDFIFIGKIIGAHGIKGAIKVYCYTESKSAFEPNKEVFIGHKANEKEWKDEKAYIIQEVKINRQYIILLLEGIINRNLAEKLIGKYIMLNKCHFPKLEDGFYYWADVIGMSVYDVEGEYVGKICSILPTGSNDVYIIKKSVKESDLDQNNYKYRERELLLPALKSYILEIDIAQKRMLINFPEGLNL